MLPFVIVALAVSLLVLLAVVALGWSGHREGDRACEARLTRIASASGGRGVEVDIENPGAVAVIVALGLRRPGVRLRLEDGTYVSVRRVRSNRRSRLSLARSPVVGVVAAGDTGTFTVAAARSLPARAELRVWIGERGRLRVLHRMVELPVAPPLPDRTPADRAAVALRAGRCPARPASRWSSN